MTKKHKAMAKKINKWSNSLPKPTPSPLYIPIDIFCGAMDIQFNKLLKKNK